MESSVNLRIYSKKMLHDYEEHPESQDPESRKIDYNSIFFLDPKSENYEKIKRDISKISDDNMALQRWLSEYGLSYEDLMEVVDLPSSERDVIKNYLPDLKYLTPKGGTPILDSETIAYIANILTDIEMWKNLFKFLQEAANIIGVIGAGNEVRKWVLEIKNKKKENNLPTVITKEDMEKIINQNEDNKRKQDALNRRKFNNR